MSPEDPEMPTRDVYAINRGRIWKLFHVDPCPNHPGRRKIYDHGDGLASGPVVMGDGIWSSHCSLEGLVRIRLVEIRRVTFNRSSYRTVTREQAS